MFEICSEVKAQEFVEKGFKGKDIGEQMFLKRVALVKDYCKTLTQSEVDNSENETPAQI
ncbi:hypothetical protein [Succinivibrio dextrinosolvens]|uniref:hypothetical protein n=1 Tax=Succinivibrio dextrinosolvens TaxID=83771 RepID=UPI00241D2872|nr:hypothetical protein [Succinivibrio dextrinosolvens]